MQSSEDALIPMIDVLYVGCTKTTGWLHAIPQKNDIRFKKMFILDGGVSLLNFEGKDLGQMWDGYAGNRTKIASF